MDEIITSVPVQCFHRFFTKTGHLQKRSLHCETRRNQCSGSTHGKASVHFVWLIFCTQHPLFISVKARRNDSIQCTFHSMAGPLCGSTCACMSYGSVQLSFLRCPSHSHPPHLSCATITHTYSCVHRPLTLHLHDTHGSIFM